VSSVPDDDREEELFLRPVQPEVAIQEVIEYASNGRAFRPMPCCGSGSGDVTRLGNQHPVAPFPYFARDEGMSRGQNSDAAPATIPRSTGAPR
jgi:hypothetical protein